MADDNAGTEVSVEVETPQATEQAKPAAGEVPPEVKRALRDANKEAEKLRLQLKEFEDRDKTEAQKLSDRAEAAERRAAELESRSVRLEVAFEKGLTPGQAKRLVGTTREELEADAEEVLREFPAKPAAPPSLDLGARGSGLSTTATDPKTRDLAQIEADLATTKRR